MITVDTIDKIDELHILDSIDGLYDNFRLVFILYNEHTYTLTYGFK